MLKLPPTTPETPAAYLAGIDSLLDTWQGSLYAWCPGSLDIAIGGVAQVVGRGHVAGVRGPRLLARLAAVVGNVVVVVEVLAVVGLQQGVFGTVQPRVSAVVPRQRAARLVVVRHVGRRELEVGGEVGHRGLELDGRGRG